MFKRLWVAIVRGISVVLRLLSNRVGMSADVGMSTAEYAVGMIAACSFAALLYKILTSPTMQSLLTDLISKALHTAL